MNTDPAQELLRLLLEDGGLSPSHINDALERRALCGGRIETALMELGFLNEDRALTLLSRCWSMPTARRGELEHPPKDCIAVLPLAVATRHRLCPLELIGRTLRVAASPPDDLEAFEAVLNDLEFSLSLSVVAVLTTEPRLSWGLRRAYHLPVASRHEEILLSWGERTNDMDAAAVAADGGVKAADATPGDDPADAAFDLYFETVPDDNGWRIRSRLKTPQPVLSVGLGRPGDEDTSGWIIPAPGSRVLPPSTSDQADAGTAGLSLIVDGTVTSSAAIAERWHADLKQLEARERATEIRRQLKVRWTVDDALAELALATTRDEMLEVTLRFAWRRLKTAAIVVKQGSRLIIWDILDDTLRGPELRPFPLDANADHALSRALRLRSPVLGPIDAGDPLLRVLGRCPRAVLILPILIGERCVGAIIGDNADRAVPPAALAELHMVVPRLGRALGHLLLRTREEGSQATAATTAATTAAAKAAATTTTAYLEVISPPEPQRTAPVIVVDPREAAVPHSDRSADDIDFDDRNPSVPGGVMTTVEVNSAPQNTATTVDPQPGHNERNEGNDHGDVPPSPGASARESLLVATWRAWLNHPLIHSDNDLDELVAALSNPGDAATVAAQRLIDAGPRGLLALARAFPGTLAHHPFGGMHYRSHVEQLAAAPFFTTLRRLGADAVAPILVGEIAHADRLHRFAAVVGLSLLDVPAALPRLAQRAFDPEQRLGTIALDVLGRHSTSPHFPAILSRLRELLTRGDDFQRRRAVRAVAALGDGGAVPLLIDMLEARPRDLADEARTALVEITCQDFGTAGIQWRAWFASHGAEGRAHWLWASLSHKDIALRTCAAHELRETGAALLHYRPDAPLRDRQEALAAITRARAPSKTPSGTPRPESDA